jgi:catechol 2,3-dioxygenase-like lactoylglutathione lyase family enzyme
MVKPVSAFSGFSVDDIDRAKAFYTEVLGLEVTDEMGGLRLQLPGGAQVYVYAKPDHQPAAYTALNFVVEDIDATVDALQQSGVTFERYDGMHQDEKGIARGKQADMGPDIAWFKDPAGTILSVLQN